MGHAADQSERERATQGSGKSTQKLLHGTPAPTTSAPGEAPEGTTQGQRQGRARPEQGRPSVGAPLVSESEAEESDMAELETEVGGIASRVHHGRPYYEHVSHRQERAQREREKQQAQRCIQERRGHSRKVFVDLMRRYHWTTGDTDDRAWMKRIWDLVQQRTGPRTLGHGGWSRCPSCAPPPPRNGTTQLQTANNALRAYTE